MSYQDQPAESQQQYFGNQSNSDRGRNVDRLTVDLNVAAARWPFQPPAPAVPHPLAAQAMALFLQLNDQAQAQYVVLLANAVKLHPRVPK